MPKRVAILSYFPSRRMGIYRSVCEDLAEHLRTIDWQVTWASAYPSRVLRLLDTIATIWLKRAQYDVAQVDVFSGPAFTLAEITCWALRRVKKPYVLVLHGGNLPAYSQRHSKRVRRLLQSAAFVTAPSRYLMDALLPLRHDILLVPNPIDTNKFQFRPRSHPEPALVWLRSIHRLYNPLLAVRVIDQLRHRFPNVHLWMVGPDKGDGTLEELKQLIEDLKLQQYIDVVGGVPSSEVPEWMQRADVFINTTNVDNTPLSVLEAMGSGLCVVSTNVGGIPSLITDGVEGLLVPPNNAEAMANAVARILTEPDLAESLSTKSKALTRMFDWSVVLQQWDELLVQASFKSPN